MLKVVFYLQEIFQDFLLFFYQKANEVYFNMAESVFEAVKQSVTVREAAQMYGIEVNRSGLLPLPR